MSFDLSKAKEPRSKIYLVKRLIWNFVWMIIGCRGPRLLSFLRVWMLRAFGAKVGKEVLFCGGVKVLEPWNLFIGDRSSISEGVNFYNFEKVYVGNNCVISKDVFFCCATHNYKHRHFPLIRRPIYVGDSCWIAMGAFIHPGVRMGDGSVVGARAVVVRDVGSGSVVAGNPAVPIGVRIAENDQD